MPTLLLVLAGCGSFMPSARAPWAGWAERTGGVVDGPERLRAQLALARLTVNCQGTLAVRILANETLGAWTFSDGSIFVGQQLVRLLSDDELAAVLAHEMGHLRSTDPMIARAAFDGMATSVDIEAHADDEGRSLLIQCGIPASSLPSALTKVRNARSTPPSTRAALDARIRRLTGDMGRDIMDHRAASAESR